MQKSISLFQVRPEKPDPEKLGVELIQRRLARIRHQMEQSQPVSDWLDVATAMWRMRQGGDDDSISGLISKPTVEDFPHYPTRLSSAERTRITAWVQKRVAAIPAGSPLSAKIPLEEREALTAAARGMRAVYLTEHQIDEAFAAVHKDFPWLVAVTEKAWRIALRRSQSGLPVGVGAMLLSGAPGLGKSAWARAVAQVLEVPSVEIDVGATGGVFDVQGIAQGWGSASKGKVVSVMVAERLGNPLIILDELDAGSSTAGTTRGSIPGLSKILMGMIEPSTAAAWTCPYFQVPVDLRHTSWVASTNDFAHIEQALLDRMTVIEIPNLTHQQLLGFAEREAKKRFDEEIVGAVVEQAERCLRRGYRLSLRHVVRLLDRVEEAADRPMLH
ncbi:AAA family ATPase [Oceaniglobus ichthyenteri]|uniref:AAA family ATPase n=1 Tax=Oceaniglobus ichthyenteri TaxID=2136177 RepID=UPI0013DE64A6|nr:AAA family ATPase [Oceaniglobus ichthyenteri]